MSQDPLDSYLEDHFAGATSAIELLDRLAKDHEGEPLAAFAAEIRREVDADRATLRALMDRVASGPHPIKELGARVLEKLSRWKLDRDLTGPLGTFESLEFLTLGILGKRALWQVLSSIAEHDSRVGGLDYENLITRAESQYLQVEARRLELASTALRAEVAK